MCERKWGRAERVGETPDNNVSLTPAEQRGCEGWMKHLGMLYSWEGSKTSGCSVVKVVLSQQCPS